MQTAYQNKSVAEGKLFRTVTSITDPMTKIVIPAGKEFKLAIGKYKSQQFAIPMVAFWGGRDNALWLTYPVKDLMEVTYETSPTDKIKENLGPIETTVPTGGATTTYGGGGTSTTTKGSEVTGIKSPLIAGYYYGK